MMLESIEHGPLVYPTFEENGQICNKRYAELTEKEQIQDDYDVQATNIVLLGLPPDVYSLVNHCQSAKYIWDRVKLLMQGTKLSYQERECKLYNEFDKFTSVKGESFHEYYLRFAQLIKYMHTIGMTMQQVKVNTKFLNDLQPEWSKFMTNVKLSKNMYNTNYDQLYAYLSQHEGHANEVRMLRERYLNHLALGQSFAGTGTTGNVTSSKAHESGQVLDEEQFEFLADPGITDVQVTWIIIPLNAAFQTDDLDAYDSDCDDIYSTKAVLMANLSSYDSNVLFAVPHHDTYQNDDMINQKSKTVNESLTAELERYKERVKTFEQRLNVDLSSQEKLIDSQMDDMIQNRNALKQEIDSLKQTLSKQVKEKESLLQTFTVFNKESKEKENKYMDKEIDLETKISKLDNIVYKVGQSAQTVHMLTKPQVFYDDTHKQALGYQNPFYLKKAQWIKPTLYDGNVISNKHDVIFVVDEEETLILEE
ncbi:hypothetical protein Tco_0478744 [Tanacetum coccineum]